MTETGLTIHQASHLMPAMSMADAAERFNQLATFTKTIMREGIDYGVIPGTEKPTLYKPGAEKLTTFFGLSVRYDTIERTEDWTGKDHGGEPFFYYWFRCQLWRGELMIAAADGSCNSWETKYRYRWADRVCPNCQNTTIIKGKEEYGGGWLCWQKRGGCGSKWKDGDPAIEQQELGRIPNPDPADIANTILKMAQKRALVAATLLAVNASEYYTQDLEDLAIEASFTVSKPGNGDGNGDKRQDAPKKQDAPKAEKQEPFEGIPSNHEELISALDALEYYEHGKHILNTVNKLKGTKYNTWPPANPQFYADIYPELVEYATTNKAQEAIKDTAEQMKAPF